MAAVYCWLVGWHVFSAIHISTRSHTSTTSIRNTARQAKHSERDMSEDLQRKTQATTNFNYSQHCIRRRCSSFRRRSRFSSHCIHSSQIWHNQLLPRFHTDHVRHGTICRCIISGARHSVRSATASINSRAHNYTQYGGSRSRRSKQTCTAQSVGSTYSRWLRRLLRTNSVIPARSCKKAHAGRRSGWRWS